MIQMYSVFILIADSAKNVCADSAIILHADTAKVIIWGTPPRMNNIYIPYIKTYRSDPHNVKLMCIVHVVPGGKDCE